MAIMAMSHNMASRNLWRPVSAGEFYPRVLVVCLQR